MVQKLCRFKCRQCFILKHSAHWYVSSDILGLFADQLTTLAHKRESSETATVFGASNTPTHAMATYKTGIFELIR